MPELDSLGGACRTGRTETFAMSSVFWSSSLSDPRRWCGGDGDTRGVGVRRNVSCEFCIGLWWRRAVELWVWIVFGVEDVGELVGSKFGLYEWDELMGFTGVAIEGVGIEVEAYKGNLFL